jgi:AmmeMemoRadiSam system protein A
MYKPHSVYCKIAFEAIVNKLNGKNPHKINLSDIPDELYETRRGCFVSLHENDGELRGCIGTIEPCETNLYSEIIRNAISAAFSDSRFKPLTIEELPEIDISVDILTTPDKIDSIDQLDPKIFGVIVTDNIYRRAVLLPGIPGISTVERQLQVVLRKAGLSYNDMESLTIYRFTSNRYH